MILHQKLDIYKIYHQEVDMISRLIFEIGGRKFKLTLEQAKELQEILNDTFGIGNNVFMNRWHAPNWYLPAQQQNWDAAVGINTTKCTIVNWDGEVSSDTLILRGLTT